MLLRIKYVLWIISYTQIHKISPSLVCFKDLFLERGEGREKERERNITGDLAHNPGMYPDWELNQ